MAIGFGEVGPKPAVAPQPTATVAPKPSVTPASEPSPFARLLHGLGREVNQGEQMVKQALDASRAGRDMSGSELLALQSGVYRYSEAVDLAAKLVDRAASGVKTVLQGQ
jgi:hypothetical protein